MVENGSAASNTWNFSPAFLACNAAEMPDTPPPRIARSSVSLLLVPGLKLGSFKIACTARAPVSAENFRSGMPLRSPTIRTPGNLVSPSGPTSGSASTLPAGQRVCSQRA